MVNSKPVQFKVDTGAAVTAVPESFSSCLSGVWKSARTLRGAGAHKLEVVGVSQAVLQLGEKKVEQEVYVVKGLVLPLLGKPAISALG